jgi:hypothetical protein
VLRTVWRMRLSTGAELHHAETPPYADQPFPVSVIKTLSRAP